jgi:hypothetical protein
MLTFHVHGHAEFIHTRISRENLLTAYPALRRILKRHTHNASRTPEPRQYRVQDSGNWPEQSSRLTRSKSKAGSLVARRTLFVDFLDHHQDRRGVWPMATMRAKIRATGVGTGGLLAEDGFSVRI